MSFISSFSTTENAIFVPQHANSQLMKSFIVAATALFTLATFSSCQKCSDCTFEENGETTTTEVCDSGRSYTDQINQFEKSGWKCTEK